MCLQCVLFIYFLLVYFFARTVICWSLVAEWKGYTSNIQAFSNPRKATRDNWPVTRDKAPASRDILPASRDRYPRQLDPPCPNAYDFFSENYHVSYNALYDVY